jgi:uncharacterized protein with ATP-grasp and redox domains
MRVCDAIRLVDVRRQPPAMAQQIHRIIRASAGEDPYREIKVQMNRLGVKLRERLRERVESAADVRHVMPPPAHRLLPFRKLSPACKKLSSAPLF